MVVVLALAAGCDGGGDAKVTGTWKPLPPVMPTAGIWWMTFAADDSPIAATRFNLHAYDGAAEVWRSLGPGDGVAHTFSQIFPDGAGGWYAGAADGVWHAPPGGQLARIADYRGTLYGHGNKIFAVMNGMIWELVDKAWVGSTPTGITIDNIDVGSVDPMGRFYVRLRGAGAPIYRLEGPTFVRYVPCTTQRGCREGTDLLPTWLPSGDELLWRHSDVEGTTMMAIRSNESAAPSDLPLPPTDKPFTFGFGANADNDIYLARTDDQYDAPFLFVLASGAGSWEGGETRMPGIDYRLFVSPAGRLYTASAQNLVPYVLE
jgi:hypothetical protein